MFAKVAIKSSGKANRRVPMENALGKSMTGNVRSISNTSERNISDSGNHRNVTAKLVNPVNREKQAK